MYKPESSYKLWGKHIHWYKLQDFGAEMCVCGGGGGGGVITPGWAYTLVYQYCSTKSVAGIST